MIAESKHLRGDELVLRQKIGILRSIGVLLLVSLSGCQPSTGPANSALPPGKVSGATSPPPETKTYRLVGEVRQIDKPRNEVTIRHEAISGFMDAMTMPFRLEDASVFEDLRVGDRVEGKLEVRKENGQTASYRLHDLQVTKPALPQSLSVDLSGTTPAIRPRPKRLQPGDAVPDFTMTGQDGRSFKLSDLRGSVVALTFIYTRCPLPDFCPAMDRRFADLAALLAATPVRAERVRLLSISFDPDHDTPEVLRKHALTRGATPPLWSFAVASHEELGRVGPPLGLVYGPGKNEVIHNLVTAVIGPDGKLARLEVGSQSNKWTSADLLKTLNSLIPSSNR